MDNEGEAFHERTRTLNVSEWGCVFLSSQQLGLDHIFALRPLTKGAGDSGNTPITMFQVVRVRREADSWLIGAWKFGTGDVWGIDFNTLPQPKEGTEASRKCGQDETE